MTTLFLAVGVASPSTVRADRFTKRRLYQEAGVSAYCIVDRDRREVEVRTPDSVFPEVERDRLDWLPPGAPLPSALELDSVFRTM